jgi:flagellar basal-body rod protein FlgG
MAIIALNAAATGLDALSTSIDVISNNLANAETTAFKGSRCNFEDLFYQELKQPGVTSGSDQVSPAGIFVGLGTKVSNTELDLSQGSTQTTNNPLDVAIQGDGFFKVKVLDGVGDGTAYTRDGGFIINNQSELVLGIGDGYRLVPPIKLPTGSTADDVSIGQDGEIEVTTPGTNTKTVVGQFQLAMFPNPQGLKLLGGSLYQETDSSGPPILVNPQQSGSGLLLQNYLEGSNVDPVTELVTLIKTQRSFEMNSQSIQTADQTLETIANLKRSG